MENNEFLEGRFWLKDDPNDIIPGKIDIKKGNKIRLKLYGQFRSLPHDPHDRTIKEIPLAEIILGVTERCDKLTLLNNRGPYLQSGGTSEIKISNWHFYSEYLFVGEWFQSIEEIRFEHVRVHFSSSEKWMKTNSVQYEFKENKIMYQPYEENYDIDIETPYQFKLKVLSITNEWFDLDDFRLEKKIYFEVLVNEKRDLEWFDVVTRAIQRFLCFIVGMPIYVDSREPLIDIKNENGSEPRHYKVPIKVFSELFVKGNCDFNFRTVKVPFHQLAPNLQDYIKNWLILYENLKPAVNLYLANYFIKDMFIEQQFLSLIQAAETIHIRKYGNQRLGYERKKRKRSSRREPYLWERLEYLIDQYWDEYLCQFVERHVFDELLVDKADLCRNYLTHHDLNSEKRIFRVFSNESNFAIALMKITLGLNLLLTIIFMEGIGIPMDLIYQIKRLTEDFQEVNEYLKRN